MESLINLVKLIVETAVALRGFLGSIPGKDKTRLGKGFVTIFRSVSRMVANARTVAAILEEFLLLMKRSLNKHNREALCESYWEFRKDLRTRDGRGDAHIAEMNASLAAFRKDVIGRIAGEAGLQLLRDLDAAIKKQADEVQKYLHALHESRIPWLTLAALFDPNLERYIKEGFVFTRDLYSYYLLPFQPLPPTDTKDVHELLVKSESDVGAPSWLSACVDRNVQAAISLHAREEESFEAMLYGRELELLRFVNEGIGRLDALREAFGLFIVNEFGMDQLI